MAFVLQILPRDATGLDVHRLRNVEEFRFYVYWSSVTEERLGRKEVTTRDVRSGLLIRHSLGPGEYPRLVQVWRSAVDATHQVLAEEHRDEIESWLATDYLPQVDLHVAEVSGLPVGLAGV